MGIHPAWHAACHGSRASSRSRQGTAEAPLGHKLHVRQQSPFDKPLNWLGGHLRVIARWIQIRQVSNTKRWEYGYRHAK
jgi:hypothetical protein